MMVMDKKKIVLIVEDEPTNAEIAQIICERSGYLTVMAVNGVEAVALARENHVDLILMDILLPVKDGLEAARDLKRDPETADIPIIAVSARASLVHRQEMFQAGMVEAIIKPYRSSELQASLARWIGN